jgi:hypothetical protein
MKYDVVFDQCDDFRILSGVSIEKVQSYCAEHGYKISRERQIGIFYTEIHIKKIGI